MSVCACVCACVRVCVSLKSQCSDTQPHLASNNGFIDEWPNARAEKRRPLSQDGEKYESKSRHRHTHIHTKRPKHGSNRLHPRTNLKSACGIVTSHFAIATGEKRLLRRRKRATVARELKLADSIASTTHKPAA